MQEEVLQREALQGEVLQRERMRERRALKSEVGELSAVAAGA